MKNFFKNVINQKQTGSHALVGRLVQVGPYNLRVESHISDGGFAAIYKVRDVTNGKAYALKHMRLMGEPEAIADCMTEINTLKALRHIPSVVSLRAAAFTGSKGREQEAYLVLDLCTINLAEYIHAQDKAMSTATIVEIFSCICQAVSAMHQLSPPLSHRDLKPENVLQHSEGGWVLCDFGSVSDKPCLYDSADQMMMGEEVIRKYTTPSYRAPEMWDLYSRERIDTKADIWALGCLLYFLMYGKLAFQAEAKLQILNGDIIVPPSRPPPLVELLRELLVVAPQRRPDILHVLRRLQEVAELLNVDPTLLIPSTPVPQHTGSFQQKSSQSSIGAGERLVDRPPSFNRDSAVSARAAPLHDSAHLQQSTRVQAIPKSSAKLQQPDPPAVTDTSSSAAGGFEEGFADFEQAFATTPAQPPEPSAGYPSVDAAPNPPHGSAPSLTPHTELGSQPPQGSARVSAYPSVHSPSPSAHSQSHTISRISAPPGGMPQNKTTRGAQLRTNVDTGQTGAAQHATAQLQHAPEQLELQAVKTQLKAMMGRNQSLKTIIQKQQETIRRLQAENEAHVTQLRQLGLEPNPVEPVPAQHPTSQDILPPQTFSTAHNGSWASFENAFETTSFSPPRSATGHTTQSYEPESSLSQSTANPIQSPEHNNLQTSVPRIPSPQRFPTQWGQPQERSMTDEPASESAQSEETSFAEHFLGKNNEPSEGRQPLSSRGQTLPGLKVSGRSSFSSMHSRNHSQTSPVKRQQMSQTLPASGLGLDRGLGLENESSPLRSAAVSPKTDTDGGHSDTNSRKSVFSAFEESLKQPALSSGGDDQISPISESTPREGRKMSLPKFAKKTHRRSNSEPAAAENWNLIKEQKEAAYS